MNRTARIRAAYALLFIVAAWSCLARLDDRRLWGDEAETALLALNITQFGIPRARDGRNEITNLPNRQDQNEEGIWTWSPWLDEYVAATSLGILGPTTLAARLPFALLALLSIGLLARVSFRTYKSHSVALVATTLMVTCVPLLLHARQARYYALAVLAQVWLIHGITRAVRKPGLGSALQVALPLAALFYANYILALAPALAVAAVGLVPRWRERETLRCLATAGLLLVLLVLPWLLYAPLARQATTLGLAGLLPNTLYYVGELHHHVLPWLILALPLLALAVRALRNPQEPIAKAPSDAARAFEFFAWSLLLFSLLVYGLSPLRFFRYLVPLIPAVLLLGGAYLTRYLPSPWLRGAVVAVLALSNAASLATLPAWPGGPSHSLGAPFLDFSRSIASDYEERTDDVVAFFRANANPGDTLWVPDPEFPLIFYTDLRVIDARLHPRLPAQPPDWILPTSVSGISSGRRLRMPPAWAPLYTEIELEVPRSRPGASRPDPHAHRAQSEPGIEALTLYKREP